MAAPDERRGSAAALQRLSSADTLHSFAMIANTHSLASRPPKQMYRGDLGPELVVLSSTQIRVAERARTTGTCVTADGPVKVRPGDFVVTMPDGERFPIKSDIFYGAYEVLSVVGDWHVGRRLLHPRRAWPIASAGAEFDYGLDRGRVSASKGGWIYQSADDDYGLINSTAQAKSHVVVGHADWVWAIPWDRWFNNASLLLTFLPPGLTVLAVLSMWAGTKQSAWATPLLIGEAVLLLLSVVAVALMRRYKWPLRAATKKGKDLASRFQSVVEALGLTPSFQFPAMSLWRAAQDIDSTHLRMNKKQLADICSLVDETQERCRLDLHHHHRLERSADIASWFAAIAIICLLALVAFFDMKDAKYIAVALPSMVGAIHAWTSRSQSASRVSATTIVIGELSFTRERLTTLANDGQSDDEWHRKEEIAMTLRTLCGSIARFTQHDLELVATDKVGVPV